MKPFITCVCATYKRPKMLANMLACYESQDYPSDRCRLIVLDDANQYSPVTNTSWFDREVCIVTTKHRFTDMAAKHDALCALAGAGLISIWDDDDVYLPWHLSSIGAEYKKNQPHFLMPSFVYSDYGTVNGVVRTEECGGRFHGSWAFTYDAWKAVGGYPQKAEIMFDQAMGRRLINFDPQGWVGYQSIKGPSSYVYRWGRSTYNASAKSGKDFAAWWEHLATLPAPYVERIVPKFDTETKLLYESLGAGKVSV